MMRGHAADFRYAFRSVRRAPGVSIVVVLSLASGIGVNTAVFSWVQARLLRPLPGVAGSASLHGVEPRTESGVYPGASWREYEDFREQLQSVADLLAFRMLPVYLGEPGRVERAYGLLVSPNYFEALGLTPALGRFPTAEEVAPARSEPIAVISHGLWRRAYGGDPAVVGRTVRINGAHLVVVGVAPTAFQGTVLGLNFEVWMPATLAPLIVSGSRELEDRGIRGYSVLGRLRPGVSRAQAQAELDATIARLARTYPETSRTIRAEVVPFWRLPRGPQRMMAAALLMLQGLMLILLLAVCGNVANLILARTSARRREVGVRLALGASRWRIASLLLAETLVLSVLAAVLAVPIALWALSWFSIPSLSGLPLRFDTPLSALGLLIATLLGLGCGLLIGGAPALQLSRIAPLPALRSGSRAAGRSRLRTTLMGLQVALALAVLLAAGVSLRSFLETRSTDPGFRRDRVLLAAYDLSGRNATAAQIRQFVDDLLADLRALASVEAAAISSSVPLDIHGLPSRVFTVEGWTRAEPGADQALTNTVTPGYFGLLDIPILAGADFARLRDAAAPPQAIVNEAFVERYLPRVEPVGRQLRVRGRTFTIVGVVRNSVYNTFGEAPTPIIYFSYRDSPVPAGEIHVRVGGGAETGVARVLREAVRKIDPDVPVFNVRTLSEHVEANLIVRRVPAQIFAVLGPMVLALMAMGIYAVVAYAVSLRTTELGVRVALGASPPRLVRDVVLENLRPIGIGAAVGWAAAVGVTRLMVPRPSVGLAVFVGVPALLLVVALVACLIPARRAAGLDPLVALRQE